MKQPNRYSPAMKRRSGGQMAAALGLGYGEAVGCFAR